MASSEKESTTAPAWADAPRARRTTGEWAALRACCCRLPGMANLCAAGVAGGLALAGLAGAEAGRTPLRFTAGEVSIQEEGGDAPQRAQALRLQAETVLAPYLKDRGFVFRGVEG